MAIRDQDTACRLAQAVQSCFQQLPKTGKPQPHEYTVLAAIALAGPCTSSDTCQFQVVALGTGTKCMGGSQRSAKGDLLHDSHAEIIARRAFMLWLHTDLRLAMQQHAASAAINTAQGDRAQVPTQQAAPADKASALVYDPEAKGFRLREGLQVVMYVSQPPCGDASIVTDHCQPGHDDGSCGASSNLPASSRQPQLSQPSGCPTTSPDPCVGPGQNGGQPQPLSHSSNNPSMEHSGLQSYSGSTSLAAQQQQGVQPPGGEQSAKLRTGAKALKMTLPSPPSGDLAGAHGTGNLPQGDLQGQVRAADVYLPQAGDVESGQQECGVLRRKPGKGDATLSLSCSDKLARWCVQGVQGALLAGLMARPVYLSALVVAMQQEAVAADASVQQAARDSIIRAVCGRLVGAVEGAIQQPFALCQPSVHLVGPSPERLGLSPSDQRCKGSGASINWVVTPGCVLLTSTGPTVRRPAGGGGGGGGAGSVEVTTAADGFKAGASRAQVAAGRAQSRLCRAALARQAVQSVREAGGAGLCLRQPALEDVPDVASAGLPDAGQAAGSALREGQLPSASCAGSGTQGMQVLAGVDGAAGGGGGGGGTQGMDMQAVAGQAHTCTDGLREAGTGSALSTGADGVQGTGASTLADTISSSRTISYQALKQQLGARYVALWQRLRLQEPFRLWIAKPQHLQTFQVELHNFD